MGLYNLRKCLRDACANKKAIMNLYPNRFIIKVSLKGVEPLTF